MKYAYTGLLVIFLAIFSSCSTNTNEASVDEKEPIAQARTSPLGIDQPDPEQLAQSAVSAYETGQIWKFLGHFGFIDQKTGGYFTPINDEDDPFFGTNATELRPLAQSLFPLMQSGFSQLTFGEPITVKNRPLTVEVPYSVNYDFGGLSEADRMSTLDQVNRSLASQGETPISFEQYVNKVQSLPKEKSHRFIYRKRQWYLDGGSWRPYRVAKSERR